MEVDWGAEMATDGGGSGAAVEVDWGGDADDGKAIEVDWGAEMVAEGGGDGGVVEVDWGGGAEATGWDGVGTALV